MGTRASRTWKPRPCSRSHDCTPEAASSPKAEPPDSAMASMPSTVCAGSSKAVSRVPGPPPRTSTLATTAASNTIAVTPEPSLPSPAWPTRRPGISVMRLRNAMMAPDLKSITAGHFKVRTGAADLPSPQLPGHLGSHEWQCAHPDRSNWRPVQLPLPLRATAGAALFGLSGGHLAGAPGGPGAGATRQVGNHPCRHNFRTRLFDRVRFARGRRQRDRLADARLFRPVGHNRRRSHHRHGPALPRPHANRAAAPAEAAAGGETGRAMGGLCDGPGFRLRLDAVHWADPYRHPYPGWLRADGD